MGDRGGLAVEVMVRTRSVRGRMRVLVLLMAMPFLATCSATDDLEAPPSRVEAVDDLVERVSLEDGSAFFFRFVDDPMTEDTTLAMALTASVVFKATGCVAVAESAAIWPALSQFGTDGLSVITPNGEQFAHGTTIEVTGGEVSEAPYSAAVAEACDPRTPIVLEIGHAS